MNMIETTNVEALIKQCESLTKQTEALTQQNAELTERLRWFEEQVLLAKRKEYGSSSERTAESQLGLFNEAESEMTSKPSTVRIPEHQRKKKQKGLKEIQFQGIPEEIIEHHLAESELVCPCCGGAMHDMGTEVRQELKVIPAEIKVVNHVRHKYACRHCEKHETSTPIKAAHSPAPVLPGSFASPSIIAYIMDQKYTWGLPLYRLEQSWSRMRITLSRQTMSNWIVAASDKWLKLVYEYMHQDLLKRNVLHADETTLQVVNESGRKAKQKSYMWLYRTGREAPPIVLFEYKPTREGENPKEFLTGFSGYLQVDGYEGYNKVKNVTLVGCWAHARRKFDEALTVLPKKDRDRGGTASHTGLEYCNRLFEIERTLKSVSTEERFKARLEQSSTLLEEFHKWLTDQAAMALPKSVIGTAVTYCLNQWLKLTAFLEDGRLEIDNNRSERSIKPFVIGRKNWLFSNTSRGANSSAVIYSIVETAKENGLDPFGYLTYLFETLPNTNIESASVLESLMPWSKDLPSSCRLPAVPTAPTAILNNK